MRRVWSLPVDLIRLNAGDDESIKKITRELVQRPDPATAIIASDGLIGLSVVEAIQELGLSIPDDVSFLMYDDFAWTRLTTPPLTVIAQPVYDMGVAAADGPDPADRRPEDACGRSGVYGRADSPRLGRGAQSGRRQPLIRPWRPRPRDFGPAALTAPSV